MADLAMIVLQSASQQLGSLLVEEAKFLYEVSDKIEKIQLDLEMLQCFLQDAAKKQHDSPLIRKWISQMRDFAYQAEDIIDKYLIKVSRRRDATGMKNTIKWISCALCDAKLLHEVGSEIDALSMRMSELSSRLQLCGVRVIASEEESNMMPGVRLVELRRTDSRIEDEDIIVGLDKDVDTVIYQLVNVDKKTVVISGMGGLGKTTLAKKVCNHMSIKGHFDKIVWVYVSQEFQPREIFKHILRKIWTTNEETIRELGDIELSRKVRDVLEGKSYLIVLDDIWNGESWDHLRPALSLPHRSTSKLLLTTRYDVVHECVDADGYLHKQEPLNPQDSWNLLERLASRGKYVIGSEMRSLGEEMLKQCKYLPLATVVIGGILKSKNTSGGWKVVHDNIHSIMTTKAEMGFRMLDVLELSYSDLPLFLRSCFLYLASFPEDYRIYVKKLYRMWEAEGMVSLPQDVDDDYTDGFHKSTTLKDVAQLFMEELVKRCMVLVEKRSDTGELEVCRLHDLMRDMCIRKARAEKFFISITTDNEKFGNTSSSRTSTLTTKLHRLAIHGSSNIALNQKDAQDAKHLRSLLFFNCGKIFPSNFLKPWTENCSVLRVLDLEGAATQFHYLPKHIGNLVHLRYFSLRNSFVKELPSSIGNLQCLQTLDLRVICQWNEAVALPNVLWKMSRLRYLYLPYKYNVRGSRGKRLRLHNWHHLETLENLNLLSCRAKDLLELPRLRSITLQKILPDKSVMMGLKVLLANPSVDSGLLAEPMHLSIFGSAINQKLVDELVQSRGYKLSVKRMHIICPMFSCFDSTVKLFQNLTSLSFEKFLLESDAMPLLGNLPSLSRLMFYDGFIGSKMVLSVGIFQELTYLHLYNLLDLEELEIEDGAMPKLQVVEIENCSKLKQLPNSLVETQSLDDLPVRLINWITRNTPHDDLPNISDGYLFIYQPTGNDQGCKSFSATP